MEMSEARARYEIDREKRRPQMNRDPGYDLVAPPMPEWPEDEQQHDERDLEQGEQGDELQEPAAR
jgi:hypothetical protein